MDFYFLFIFVFFMEFKPQSIIVDIIQQYVWLLLSLTGPFVIIEEGFNCFNRIVKSTVINM